MVKMADLVIRFGGCGGFQFWDKTFLRRVLLLISIKIRLTPLLRRGVLHSVMRGFGVQLIFFNCFYLPMVISLPHSAALLADLLTVDLIICCLTCFQTNSLLL